MTYLHSSVSPWKRSTLLASLISAGLLTGCSDSDNDSAPAAEATPSAFRLTVLHNNDGESDLLPNPSDARVGGAARFVTLVTQEQTNAVTPVEDAESVGVVTLSSGDNFLAGLAFEASQNRTDGEFFDAEVLASINYDAICLGNHDFDFGADTLANFITSHDNFFGQQNPSSTDFPEFLTANLDFSGEANLQALVDSGRIASSTIVTTGGEQIGIIGATTENLASISNPEDVVINEVLPAIQAEVAALTAQNVNKIILISHLQGIAAELELIESLTDVDIVIAGGGDELLANDDTVLSPISQEGNIFGSYPLMQADANGVAVPVVTTEGNYRYLGRLVVDFDDDGNLVQVVAENSDIIRVVGIPEGQLPLEDAVPDDIQTQANVIEPLEDAIETLSETVVGNSEVALNGVRSSIRSRETGLGNLIADALLAQGIAEAPTLGVTAPDVAIQNGGGIRNNAIIPAGELTRSETIGILPFPNFVAIIPDISRAQFLQLVEHSVSNLDANDPESSSGAFGQIGGFTFNYDATRTAQVVERNDDGSVSILTPGDRVLDITLDDGTQIVVNGVVVDGPALTVATNTFTANNGDDYPFNTTFTPTTATYEEALANFIAGPELNGVVTAAAYPENGEGRITEINGLFPAP